MLSVFEAFAGYGGGGFALKKAKIPFEVVGFSEIDKYAIQCYLQNHGDIKNYGDITKINWKEVPDFDLLLGGFPCFEAGTHILSKKGYTPIESIIEGDEVLTHKGRWKKVTKIMCREKAKIFEVRGTGILPTHTTNEHPYFVRKITMQWDNKRRTYFRKFGQPEWKPVSQLNTGFFASQILPPEQSDNNTPAFWWLVGRYLADGWRVKRKGRKNGRVVICCERKEETELANRIKDAGFNSSIARERTVTKFHITKGSFYSFLESFGHLATGKTLPIKALCLDKEKSKILFDGWVSGDGNRNKKQNLWNGTTVSPTLALGLSILAQRFGKVANVYFSKMEPKRKIEGRLCNQHNQYTIRVCDINRSSFIEGGYGWKLIRKVSSTGRIAKVYNLAVEEDESYIANGAIVHNCQDISIAGRQDLGQGRSVLVFELIKALEAKQPKYFLFENVSAIEHEKFRSFLREAENLMKRAGYSVYRKCLNTKDFGVPQNRERVWFIGYRKDIAPTFGFVPYPKETGCQLRLFDLLEKEVDKKYYLSEKMKNYLIKKIVENKFPNSINPKTSSAIMSCYAKMGGSNTFVSDCIELTTDQHQGARVYSPDGLSICLSAQGGGMGAKTGLYAVGCALRQRDRHGKGELKEQQLELGGEFSNALTSVQKDSLVFLINTTEIRRLSPKECFRLMGFQDGEINLKGISDSQLYHLAGNGWDVNIVSKIFQSMNLQGGLLYD